MVQRMLFQMFNPALLTVVVCGAERPQLSHVFVAFPRVATHVRVSQEPKLEK